MYDKNQSNDNTIISIDVKKNTFCPQGLDCNPRLCMHLQASICSRFPGILIRKGEEEEGWYAMDSSPPPPLLQTLIPDRARTALDLLLVKGLTFGRFLKDERFHFGFEDLK